VAAANGGGSFNAGGARENQGQCTRTIVSNCMFSHNKAIGSDNADGVSSFGTAIGGGILSGFGAALTVKNTAITNNQAIGGSSTIGPGGVGAPPAST